MMTIRAVDIEDLAIFNDLFVAVRTGLNRHHGIALRDQVSANLRILGDQPGRSGNGCNPAHTFFEGLHPIIVLLHFRTLIWIGQKPVKCGIQSIPWLIYATANRNLDVGINLLLRDRIFRVQHHRKGRCVGFGAVSRLQ